MIIARGISSLLSRVVAAMKNHAKDNWNMAARRVHSLQQAEKPWPDLRDSLNGDHSCEIFRDTREKQESTLVFHLSASRTIRPRVCSNFSR